MNIVFLTGAGMSAESGISTFRDSGGLWDEFKVEDVASIEGWRRNPKLVQEFYNLRREQLANVEPNQGHRLIAELEQHFRVTIVTQNVDNLHEKAGSSNIIHLHGELTKACNEKKTEVIEIGTRAIEEGELAQDGSRLRPFIVWFGEAVPLIEQAAEVVSQADILVIIGTSLQVYPAAALVRFVKKGIPIYLIDPKEVSISGKVELIRKGASEGMQLLTRKLLE